MFEVCGGFSCSGILNLPRIRDVLRAPKLNRALDEISPERRPHRFLLAAGRFNSVLQLFTVARRIRPVRHGFAGGSGSQPPLF